MDYTSTLFQALDRISAYQKMNSGRFPLVMHCTNPHCHRFGYQKVTDDSWYREHGTYSTKAFGEVQRYQCLECGKTFSDQSFSMDYWVHRPVDYLPLLKALVSTSGQGNLTRFSGLSYKIIQNRNERLCRFFLAVHARLRQKIALIDDYVVDGFESFAWSQFFPNNINILVGSKSEFIYAMSFAQLRRKGSMTPEQKEKRAKLESILGKAPPKAVEDSMASLLEDLCILLRSKEIPKKELRSDEHKAYPRALARVKDSDKNLEHLQYSSKAERNYTNPLFAVNYVDRQFRKDQVNHVRETVQFSRCPTAMMVRLTIYQIYHNYMMPKRVRDQRQGDWLTRGEFLGLHENEVIEVMNEFWGRRVFFHKTQLWNEEEKTWKMEWRNKGILLGRRVPKHIFI